MRAQRRLDTLLRSARVRAALRTTAFALPAVAALLVLAWRLRPDWAPVVLLLGTFAAAIAVAADAHRFDRQWLARRLDARDPRMEDSASLLLVAADALPPLARLQRARLQQRLEAAPPPDLRPAWHAKALSASAVSALVLVALVLLWPPPTADLPTSPAPRTTRAPIRLPTHTAIVAQRLDIMPPAYTRLPRRSGDSLETRVPEGATVRWALRFSPGPASASLAFHDGRTLALVREGDEWIATARIDKPVLYRIALEAAPPLRPDRLHRLDVVIDQPPRLEVRAPQGTLTLRSPGQRAWSFAVEAHDDYGLAPTALLRVTLAQGSGENVRFEERALPLHGQGGGARRRYAHTFELAPLGLSPGDEVVVHLSVADNRAGRPQTTRTASYILRAPAGDLAEGSGVEGVVKKAMPAYFRSQRQIIIDSEALIAQQRKLAPGRYLERADAIGVDQRLLRLRYGQFLGEESEGARARLLPTADAEAEAEDDTHAAEASRLAAPASGPTEATHDHDGDRSVPASPGGFGRAGDVLESYGHTHDDAEAATLLDPQTRRKLKAALDQMWQAELHLRQGRPDLALPYEYKALDYIKQVQQADRVYLARVGSQLPPVDESRRLGGDRTGLQSRGDPLVPAQAPPPELARLWRGLGTPGATASARDLDALGRWLRANEQRLPDALGVIAALDTLRREPLCSECRQRLRGRLWPILPRPPAAAAPRVRPDRSGQAYLDALEREGRR